MDTFEKFMILFIIVFFTSLSVAVIKTAHGIQEVIEKEYNRREVPLAEKCEQYFNDGTDQWKECMGVGLVPAPVGSASREGRMTEDEYAN